MPNADGSDADQTIDFPLGVGSRPPTASRKEQRNCGDYPLLMDSLFPFPQIIGSPLHRYVGPMQDARRHCFAISMQQRETTMRKIVLTVVGASLMAASTIQMAAAAGNHVHKADRAAASQQFRNANNAADWSAGPRYSGGFSAPAGR
jgi:hypothetical protein